MNKIIENLIIRAKVLDIERIKLQNAVKALQEVCEHDWSYDGHSHNDSVYVCNECGKEDLR